MNFINIKRIRIIVGIICISVGLEFAYGGVVADQDGMAFVTKQTFENLKADFEMQINRYNASLDNKIDGAISSYLSGIKVLKKGTRTKLIRGANNWLMYNVDDYPKYQEGYPYLTGYSMYGTFRDVTPSGNVWSGVNYNGNNSNLDNGNFKKHIIASPSNNLAKNGNSDYVSEWLGYYKDEGEFIGLGNFTSRKNGSWAADDEIYVRFNGTRTFENSNCPVEVAAYILTNDFRSPHGFPYGTSTTMWMSAVSAQRLAGEIVGDTNVSIYKNISDNRFWDSTKSNRVGITPTTPAIRYLVDSANYVSWLQNIFSSLDVKMACNAKVYNATNGRYTIYNQSFPYPYFENFEIEYETSNYLASGTGSVWRLIKLANDPNNLQFIRLWSGVTDTVAQNLNTKMEDANTPAADKATIKAALLWDQDNVPHLSMGAGYPFLEVSYDEEVEFNFKIKESGSYRVYAKYGPFSPTGNAATEADVTFDISSGGTTTHSTMLPATGGVNTRMKFKVTKDGTNYIFLKWCDNTTNKGGTMDVSNDPVVTPAL